MAHVRKRGAHRAKCGRQPEWTDELRDKLLNDFYAYIERTAFPNIYKFAYTHGVNRQRLFEWEEFADAVSACTSKAGAYLIEKGIKNKGGKPVLVPSVVIFALKNILHWRDVWNIEHSGGIDPVANMTPEERKARIAVLLGKANADAGGTG